MVYILELQFIVSVIFIMSISILGESSVSTSIGNFIRVLFSCDDERAASVTLLRNELPLAKGEI